MKNYEENYEELYKIFFNITCSLLNSNIISTDKIFTGEHQDRLTAALQEEF